MIHGHTTQEVINEVSRQARARQDMIVRSETMMLDVTSTPNGPRYSLVTDNGHGPDFAVTRHAHSQIAASLDIPGGYYSRMMEKHPKILLGTVNNLFRSEPKNRMLRTLDGNARAWLSDKYKRMDSDQLVVRAAELISDRGFKINSAFVDGASTVFQVISPRLQAEVRVGDVVQAGFVLHNNEVGAGAWAFEEMLYRLACTNGMVRGQATSRWIARHVGARQGVGVLSDDVSVDTVWNRMRDRIIDITSETYFHSTVKELREAADDRIGNPEIAVQQATSKLDLTQPESAQVLINLLADNDLTRWGLANAITKVANTHESYHRAVELEAIGGEVMALTSTQWAEMSGVA